MIDKIIDTAAKPADAAADTSPKTAKKHPAAQKKSAESGGFCVYLGPTMMGVIQRGTIYRAAAEKSLTPLPR